VIVNASALRLPLADASVDAALCSPPYWGALRVYEGPQVRPWPAISYAPMPGLPPVDVPAQAVPLGHEPDPFAFVGHLLQVFREVRRVLVPGGCLAVNLGDSYTGNTGGIQGEGGQRAGRRFTCTGKGSKVADGLRPKNLALIPWRFALAMQADGWILRSRMPGGVEVLPGLDVGIEPDIVWRKPSCMPESVRDRPTVDFEDVLLFSQGPRYFFDQEAGREERGKCTNIGPSKSYTAGAAATHGTGKTTLRTDTAGRNMRSSWTMSPEPTDEEHFAAWPVALAARLIRVLTSERGRCPECGAPWVRQAERRAGAEYWADRRAAGEGPRHGGQADGLKDRGKIGGAQWRKYLERFPDIDRGWAPICAHDVEPVPCVVLDPFAGIGRTWEAAREAGRRFVGSDLGMGYCRLAMARNDLAAMARRREAESQKVKTITGPLFGDAP
jgi:DNA modification methylase